MGLVLLKNSCGRTTPLMSESSPALIFIWRRIFVSPMKIDDLSGVVLVEILCRLPCYKLVFQSKCVSKRWCALISDPYFTGRFLCHLHSDIEAPPVFSSLLNRQGWAEAAGSTSQLLAPVFRKLTSFHGLKYEPKVEATYNDLVLCFEGGTDYYICNPYTQEWVALPPSPWSYPWPQRKAPAAIICDRKYYDYTTEGRVHNTILVSADYRCKVVRILPFVEEDPHQACRFTLEIFSSETGEWKVSTVTSLVPLNLSTNHISVAYNGMLYWWDLITNRYVGMDPFMINSNSSAEHFKLSFIKLDDRDRVPVLDHLGNLDCLGICRRDLRMCSQGAVNGSLYVWHREEEDRDQNGVARSLLAFDANDNGMLYLHVDGQLSLFNIRTRNLSKLVGKKYSSVHGRFFPLVIPWWPTPVPRLPKPSWPSNMMYKLMRVVKWLVFSCFE